MVRSAERVERVAEHAAISPSSSGDGSAAAGGSGSGSGSGDGGGGRSRIGVAGAGSSSASARSRLVHRGVRSRRRLELVRQSPGGGIAARREPALEASAPRPLRRRRRGRLRLGERSHPWLGLSNSAVTGVAAAPSVAGSAAASPLGSGSIASALAAALGGPPHVAVSVTRVPQPAGSSATVPLARSPSQATSVSARPRDPDLAELTEMLRERRGVAELAPTARGGDLPACAWAVCPDMRALFASGRGQSCRRTRLRAVAELDG